MRRFPSSSRGGAAFVAGAALGISATAGIALLLYTGQGFLRAAGLLAASTIMSVGAGIWAGAPEPGAATPPNTRWRWTALIIVLLAAGTYAMFWNDRPALREQAFGSAVAMLLILAMPAYVAGAVFAGLSSRDATLRQRSAASPVASAATAGVALGVLLATASLIQTLDPQPVFYTAAALVAFGAMLDRGRITTPRTGVFTMNGHVALITGAGRQGQLGYTLAQRFLDAGARVVITARSESIDEHAASLRAHGDVTAVRADLTSDADVAHLIDDAVRRYGRIDSVINAAGGLTLIKSIADTTPEEWRAEVERNVETTLRVCRAALPQLRESRGAIINFASPAGERAVPMLGAYSAAKAGVIALTRALAVEEIRNGVRVNAIAPGMMDTEQNVESATSPNQKYVTRDDVASAVLFLAGDGGRAISGEVVHVAGPTLR
jgi:3-oxoacyl-[acyl-carrier protein] reductase